MAAGLDDSHSNHDIDNLPLHNTKAPMLSLTTLRNSPFTATATATCGQRPTRTAT